MRKKPTTKLAPIDANTTNQVCELPRDNVDTDEHWIITDGATVTIAAQRPGVAATAMVKLPKPTFDAFVRWYTTGRWRTPRKKAVPS